MDNMKANNRYVWLLFTLFKEKRLTFEEIQQLWKQYFMGNGKPFSLRTFHLHRKMIKELYDIDIECDRKDGYRYYIANMDSIMTNHSQKWTFCTKIISAMLYDSWSMRKRIIFEDQSRGLGFMPDIIRCDFDGKEIVIFFTDDKGKEIMCRFQTYGFKFYNGRWYVLGYENSCSPITSSIALDSITDIKLSGFDYDPHLYFDLDNFLKYSIGVQVPRGQEPQEVCLRVYHPYQENFRKNPFHPTQEEKYDMNTFTVFTYKLYITDELVDELIKLGDKVSVSYPEELRIKVLRKINRIMERYKTF